MDFLARLGILVAPGDFYGPAAASRHVRVALTATDERIAVAAPPQTPRFAEPTCT